VANLLLDESLSFSQHEGQAIRADPRRRAQKVIHMIRKGQACGSAPAARVGLLHRLLLVCLEFNSDSFSYRTQLHTCPSIRAEPTCSSKSSANATNAVLSSSPPTKPLNKWPAIFNGDSTITFAVLDRLLHHAETILIEGSSYRMKDRTET
jgi:hypothetical protein